VQDMVQERCFTCPKKTTQNSHRKFTIYAHVIRFFIFIPLKNRSHCLMGQSERLNSKL
jgi:hypothetical protein